MNSKDILLAKFRDNITRQINASDIRMFVNAVYSEFLHKNNVIDGDSNRPEDVISANEIANIKKKVDEIIRHVDQDTQKVHYTKEECDAMFSTTPELFARFYSKDDTYSKKEVAEMYYTKAEVDQMILELNERMYALIRQNNLRG